MTSLCALPSCRIRGRHLPVCADEACAGCLPRTTDEGLICDADMARAEGWLRDIIRHAPDARLVAAGLVRRGAGGGSGKPGSQSPGNDGAMDVLHAVGNALTTIVREIAETRGLQIDSAGLGDVSPADPITRAAKWLCAQLDWLRHATDGQGQAYAAGMFAEIRDCAAKLRSLVEGPGEYHYLGPCGAPLPGTLAEPDREIYCEGDVRWRPGNNHGTCRHCGATFDLGDRQRWLDQVRREWLYSATEIADAYPDINVNTIRTWLYRGQLTAHGEYAGGPLLKLGEVLDLAAESTARREEARARRQAQRAEARSSSSARLLDVRRQG